MKISKKHRRVSIGFLRKCKHILTESLARENRKYLFLLVNVYLQARSSFCFLYLIRIVLFSSVTFDKVEGQTLLYSLFCGKLHSFFWLVISKNARTVYFFAKFSFDPEQQVIGTNHLRLQSSF